MMKSRTNQPMQKYRCSYILTYQGLRSKGKYDETFPGEDGVHTKPLNGVSIRKNVSCGFYNMKAEKCTTLIHESSAFQLFLFHIYKSPFSFSVFIPNQRVYAYV